MNNRFEQLKEQCWVERDWDQENSRWVDRHIDLTKFAELIVRECANLSKDRANYIVSRAEKFADDEEEITIAKSTAWQFLVLETEIKNHFGVDK